MTLLKDIISRNRQFVLYCVIGISGVSLDFCTYSVFLAAAGLPYQLANALGYAAGTALSFFLNAFFNFKTRDRLALRLLSFSGVALLGWATSAGILFLAVSRMGCDKYLAKLMTIVAVVLLQYNFNRLLSFRKSRGIPHG